MPVNTKKVAGRRAVKYASLDELLADARRFSEIEFQKLGNWSPGQIYEHLARTMNCSLDGFDMTFPAPLRWIMSLFMKKRMLYKSIPAGFKSTAKMVASDSIATETGLANLEQAIHRHQGNPTYVLHPGFGKLTPEEWIAFHLRHAEMHMSFLIPQN